MNLRKNPKISINFVLFTHYDTHTISSPTPWVLGALAPTEIKQCVPNNTFGLLVHSQRTSDDNIYFSVRQAATL
jgi:hypothetical protein